MKTQFLSNASHELKTPLTVMSLRAQALRGELERLPQAKGAVDAALSIAAEADRLALMVGQVLDITRIEEGNMAWDMTPCHIDEIIYGAVQTHFPILNEGNNRLEIQMDEALPLVLADAPRVSQVVVNLVTNALRHTRNGQITLLARARGREVTIVVEDNGEGITPGELPFVFERYRTGENPRGTGTGLGLYICKQIIEAHGGEIHIESDAGKGTRVTFTLPAVNTEPC
jgi:signal transduction histidine kinase